jgi:hypothetical protein
MYSSIVLDLDTRLSGWSTLIPGRYITRNVLSRDTNWTGGWMGTAAGLDAVEKNLLHLSESNPSRPARDASICRVRSPAVQKCVIWFVSYFRMPCKMSLSFSVRTSQGRNAFEADSKIGIILIMNFNFVSPCSFVSSGSMCRPYFHINGPVFLHSVSQLRAVANLKPKFRTWVVIMFVASRGDTWTKWFYEMMILCREWKFWCKSLSQWRIFRL